MSENKDKISITPQQHIRKLHVQFPQPSTKTLIKQMNLHHLHHPECPYLGLQMSFVC